jgi:hypothetical protein
MSNVPAYPKNPALHCESMPPQSVEQSREDEQVQTSEATPIQLRDLDLSPPRLSFKSIVRRAPMRAIVIAAGIGVVAGRLARR